MANLWGFFQFWELAKFGTRSGQFGEELKLWVNAFTLTGDCSRVELNDIDFQGLIAAGKRDRIFLGCAYGCAIPGFLCCINRIKGG